MGRRRKDTPAAVSEDEIDQFHNQKDAIMFDEDAADSGAEESEEAIMDLPDEDVDDASYEEDDESEPDTKWGRHKKSYYSADTRAIDEEAQEARKIQQRKLQSMKPGHFIPEGVTAKSAAGKTESAIILSGSEEEQSEEEEEDDFKKFLLEEPSQLVKDLIKSEGFRALEETQKLKLLEDNSVPFASFMSDFRSKFEEAHEQLQPLLERINKDSSTREGLGFLKAKCHLLLAYCTNVAFYCGMRLTGKSVVGHPVIERMVRFRLLLEKMKPLEKKLKGQIDKLLQSESAQNLSDPLLHKPNPDLLMLGEGEEEQVASAADGVYKAPKIAPMHYPEDKAEKVDRQRERQRRMESQSQLLRELRADIEDAPEEEAIDVVYGNRKDRCGTQKASERDAYEEENLVRFTLTKRDKLALKESEGKPVDELAALDDFFGELDSFQKDGTRSTGGTLGKILGIKQKRPSSSTADVQKERKKNKKNKASDSEESIDSDLSEIEDDLDHYNAIKQSHNSRKAASKAAHSKEPKAAKYRNIQDMPEGETKRPASWKILKNKGLTPNRPKEVRNPRVHRRVKYERAIKRIGSFKPAASEKSGPYGGEGSGIRTNLSKSVKFK